MFLDPGAAIAGLALPVDDIAFRLVNDVGRRDILHFEAQLHGPRVCCLRFAAPVARTPRKTRFRLAARLGRAGLSPAGFHWSFDALVIL